MLYCMLMSFRGYILIVLRNTNYSLKSEYINVETEVNTKRKKNYNIQGNQQHMANTLLKNVKTFTTLHLIHFLRPKRCIILFEVYIL